MLTTIYVAQGNKQANAIEKLAINEGFYIKIQDIGKDGNIHMFEIITLESEAREFYELLIEYNMI